MNHRDIKSVFTYLQKNESYLNQNQLSFIGSLKTYFNRNKMLSEKQIFILNEIAKYIEKQGVPVPEKTLF